MMFQTRKQLSQLLLCAALISVCTIMLSWYASREDTRGCLISAQDLRLLSRLQPLLDGHNSTLPISESRPLSQWIEDIKLTHSKQIYRKTLTTSVRTSISDCHDSLCFEYLSSEEKNDFEWCMNKTKAMEYKFGPLTNGTCRFMNGTGRYPPGPVALASQPGSGNTWVRGLLEKATGICTGSVYCDGTFRTGNFTGEGIKGLSAIAVKTHNIHPNFKGPDMKERPPSFGSAIFLVRNPKDALVADWHRRRNNRNTNDNVSNHVLSVGPEYFGYNKDWNAYVHLMSQRWSQHVTAWLASGKTHPMIVVEFEDVKANPVQEIRKMLDFMQIAYDVDELVQRLKEDYSVFHRKRRDDFDHFTPTQKSFVNGLINETISALEKSGLADVFPIHKYL